MRHKSNKMHFKILFYLLLIYCVYSCNKKSDENVYSDYILVDNYEEVQIDEIPSKFLDNKKYIHLYSDDVNLQFKEITKIMIKDDLVYILDEVSRKLLIYDKKTGEAVRSVGRRGSGPDEYILISDFDVDNDGNIYMIDGNLNKLFIYKNDLSQTISKKLPFEPDIIKVLDNGNFLFGLSSWNKGENKGDLVVLTNKKLETLNKLVVYDKFVDDAFWISNFYFTSTNSHILLNRPPYNTVYKINNLGVVENSIFFDFGRLEVPEKEKANIEENLQKFENYNLLKWRTIVEENYIIGTFRKKGKTRPFFIDRIGDILYLYPERRVSDNSDVAGYYDKTLISYIIPGSEKAESAKLPPNIKRELSNGDFVLCIYELK